MPNYSTNDLILKGTPEALKTVRDAITGEVFDFGKLLPMPAEIAERHYTVTAEHADLFLTYYQRGVMSDEMVKFLTQSLSYPATLQQLRPPTTIHEALAEIEKNAGLDLKAYSLERARLKALYGAADNYTWALRNWGSKWPGTYTRTRDLDGGLRVNFATPWAPPGGVLDYLANTLGLELDLCYWIDDHQGLGRQWIQDGQYQSLSIQNAFEESESTDYISQRVFGDWQG